MSDARHIAPVVMTYLETLKQLPDMPGIQIFIRG